MKRIALAVGLSLLVAGLAWLVLHRSPPEAPPTAAHSEPPAAPLATGRAPIESAEPEVPLEPPPARSEPRRPPELALPPEFDRAVERYREAQTEDERTDTLLEIALSDEPAVLPFLLDELVQAPEGERAPVIWALMQHGSREAVPGLRALAGQTGLPEERRRLQEAADWLELPSLTEVRRGLWKPGSSESPGR